ncbi:BspA family leucine-rich repeat surface protein [Paratractidigestivibacter sp.]|uniref:BspA family leucine-rich repeat surface protein n=1 Tax=Paratractidigestivibacter sp. TaxID=2847316 RepID=UPI002ACB12D3|nr:BspA family leucine-rich repeat surface protein [Paratractidigestivibacter sp.]
MANDRFRAPLAALLGLSLLTGAAAFAPALALAIDAEEQAAVAGDPTASQPEAAEPAAAEPEALASATLTQGWTLYHDTCEYRVDESGCLILRPLGGASYAEVDSIGGWWGISPNSFRVEGEIKVTGDSLVGAFAGMSTVYSISLYGLDTSSVTNMQSMLAGCTSLTWFDLSFIDTSHVTDMSALFSGCSSLSSVGLSCNTSRVTTMQSMFGGCSSLTWLDFSKFDTSSVTNLQGMFYNCTALTSLDLNHFDTSKVTMFDCMLANCPKLTTLDLSSFDTSSIKNVASCYDLYGDMFGSGTHPTTIKLGKKFDFTGADSKRFIKFPSDTSLLGYRVKWLSSADGKLYDADKIPSGVVATYTAQKASSQMYRLYNTYTGEHLYTADKDEVKNCVAAGWKYEGNAWAAPSKSSTPVYRLYNPYVAGGDHHYTADEGEYKWLQTKGWKGEGIGWYSDDAKGVAVYRAYNPYAVTGTHHYTTDKDEFKEIVDAGWKDEGIAWYGMK